jgi:BirA family transcriptional regulator, biotin operon repressor / biotin---[acetyl-CoA-carboxylase] ligase
MNEPLDITAVTNQLPTRWLGQHLIYLPEVGSTNDWLKAEMALRPSAELPGGTLVITDYQSQGRGRLARRWEAPPRSSLLLTLLFRPEWPGERANWLTMMACAAAAEAIAAVTQAQIGIKWPNDLVVGQPGNWRKVGGLLLEANFSPAGMIETALVGIGLNVNIQRENLPPAVTPAASLLLETGQPVNRERLLMTFLTSLESRYDAAALGRSPYPDWQARLVNIGQPVEATDFVLGRTIRGTAVGVNDWGHLIVTDGDGRRHTISAGDVTLRPIDFSAHSQ